MPADGVFRLLVLALAGSICLSLFPDSPARKILRFLTALLLLVSLRPGEIPDLPDPEWMLREYRIQGQAAAEAGLEAAGTYRLTRIREALEAYILDKAASYGCSLTASVTLDEEGYPTAAVLTGSVTQETKEKLETILLEELGIAKEDQRWNGQQILPSSENG